MGSEKITSLSVSDFTRYNNKALREIDNGIPVEGVVDDFLALSWERELAEEVAYKAFNVRTKSNNIFSTLSLLVYCKVVGG